MGAVLPDDMETAVFLQEMKAAADRTGMVLAANGQDMAGDYCFCDYGRGT